MSGDRIPVGAVFSTTIQADPVALAAYNAMRTGSFPGINLPESGVDHPSPSSAKFKESVKQHIISTSEISSPVIG
jgi:hypothetical protein